MTLGTSTYASLLGQDSATSSGWPFCALGVPYLSLNSKFGIIIPPRHSGAHLPATPHPLLVVHPLLTERHNVIVLQIIILFLIVLSFVTFLLLVVIFTKQAS